MPVIAFNASAKVAEWYNDIQKGKRSKVLNGRLEQAIRLIESDEHNSRKGYSELELEIQELQENIKKYQARLFIETSSAGGLPGNNRRFFNFWKPRDFK